MTNVSPPPREVVPTHPMPVLKAIGRLFLAVVVAITLMFVGALLNEAALASLGRDVVASVRSLHEHPDSTGAYGRIARYRYAFPGGVVREDHTRVNWAAFRRLSTPFNSGGGRPDDMVFSEGASGVLTVRAYEVGPLRFSRAVEHEWGAMLWIVPAIFAPTMGFLGLALYLALVLRPRWRRWLYTDGAAVAGRVTGSRTVRSRYGTEIHFIHYTFTPVGSSAAANGVTMVAGGPEMAAAVANQDIVVLYDPGRPRRNVAYEYGGYRWA